MLVILLKSSTCLAIFMLFYKLCLEKTSAHTFKRFYLISAVLISICIPFITFIEYIEVQPEIFANNLVLDNNEKFQTVESTSLKDYIPIILWSIYILGTSIFSFRFLKNLNNLFQKIKRNPKFKNENTFHVLLQELITPHTFLNYIFLNKTKYENNQIPHEVLLHEQTHANQKHALDIIFIEILQIVFWFNPLLYLIKNDIKLNHEFLADQAVINKGINTKNYQQLLLAFSSNVSHSSLANAINYSLIGTERSRSIKKRFTVMKTKTSKTALWFRSFIILPLLAILIYSFSSRDIIEKEFKNSFSDQENILEKNQTSPQKANQLKEIAQISTGTTIIGIIDNKTIAINHKKYSLKNFEKEIVNLANNLSTKEKEKFSPIIVHSSPPDDQTLKKVENILKKYNLLKDYSDSKTVINFSQEKNMFIISLVKATPEQLIEYNKLAKHYSEQTENKRIIKRKDVLRLEYIYSLMTKEQKENAEPFPKFVPPPPSPKASKTAIEVIEAAEAPIDIPPPSIPANATLEQKAKYKKIIEAYSKEHPEAVTKRTSESGEAIEIVEVPMNLISTTPQVTKTPLDQVINMAKKGATFYYEDKEITLEKAKEIVINKKDEHLGISTHSIEGKHSLKIWDYDPSKNIPLSNLDYIIKMSETDAIFFYENNKITSKEAINLIKKNKKLNVSARYKNGVNVVKIRK